MSSPGSCSINCGGCLGIGWSSRGSIDVSSEGGIGGMYSWISGKAKERKRSIKMPEEGTLRSLAVVPLMN